MAIRVDNKAVTKIYKDGKEITSVILDGETIFNQAGVPTIRSFTISPDKLTIGSAQQTLTLGVSATGSEYAAGRINELVELLADGTRTVILAATATSNRFNTSQGNSVSFSHQTPSQDAQYILTLTNANGTSSEYRQFHYGRIPTISQWEAGNQRQSILSTPATIELRWNVTGGHPTPTLDITTNRGGSGSSINFHPSVLHGTHRYTHVGAGTSEILTLTATNVFGTVSRDLTITWGS